MSIVVFGSLMISLLVYSLPKEFFWEAASKLAGKDGTIFADSYGESKFQRISPGWDAQEVLKEIGPPAELTIVLRDGTVTVKQRPSLEEVSSELSNNREGVDYANWQYTVQQKPNSDYRVRNIIIKNNIVDRKQSYYWID